MNQRSWLVILTELSKGLILMVKGSHAHRKCVKACKRDGVILDH